MRKIDVTVGKFFADCVKYGTACCKVLSYSRGVARDRVVSNEVHVACYLFGTVIFIYDRFEKAFYFFASSKGANNGNGVISQTTKSRLNGLLNAVGFQYELKQRNYRLYLGDMEVETDEDYRIVGDCKFEKAD